MNKESEKELNKGIYGLEITTTQACNFRCSYCFEKDHSCEKILLNKDIIIKRVNELLEADWFQDQYSGIKIILWGGEPTMNMPLCQDLMKAFESNKRVCFFLYTNGSTIKELILTLEILNRRPFIKKNMSKVTVQVSYDGAPTHKLNRKDRDGKSTVAIVLYAIGLLDAHGIDYGLKATMSWKDYKYLPECWDDYYELNSKVGSKIKYALTVDYYNVEFDKYKDEVEEALIEVSQREIKFFRERGYFLSNIFRNNQSLCATGKSMAVIDTNGDVYNCHGCIYSKCSNDFKYSNIFDENFINRIRRANILYKNNHIEPEECKECIATSCLRCNVKKYEESNKKTHLDRWYDYPAQEDLCNYYKLIGKISNAIGSILKGE